MTVFKSLLSLAIMGGACGYSMIASAEITDQNNIITPKIVGGDEAVSGNYPFMVSVQSQNGSHFCGASVIDSRWILTAAHCVSDVQNPAEIRVAVGLHDVTKSSSGQVLQVSEVIVHNGYNSNTMTNDIALLKVSSTIDSQYAPINIASSSDYPAGTSSTVIGWGTLSEGGSMPRYLQEVELPAVSLAQCRAAYGSSAIHDHNVCAGFPQGGKDSCQGDSGGPLFIEKNNEFYQVGVVSWGDGCARADKYGVYTSAASFTQWISDNTVEVPDDTGVPGELINGQAETSLSASLGTKSTFYIDVPAGASNLLIDTTGGSGDVDMYVRLGDVPTDDTYDCRPYKQGNTESCAFSTPTEGRYYVVLKAYDNYSGLTLSGSFEGGVEAPADNSGHFDNVTGSKDKWLDYSIDVANGAQQLTVSISGGTGDADLYVRQGSAPSTTAYDCRPYKSGNEESCEISNPTAGEWFISLRGYSDFSGLSLDWNVQ